MIQPLQDSNSFHAIVLPPRQGHLPREVFENILSFLNDKDLWVAKNVCRYWYHRSMIRYVENQRPFIDFIREKWKTSVEGLGFNFLIYRIDILKNATLENVSVKSLGLELDVRDIFQYWNTKHLIDLQQTIDREKPEFAKYKTLVFMVEIINSLRAVDLMKDQDEKDYALCDISLRLIRKGKLDMGLVVSSAIAQECYKTSALYDMAAHFAVTGKLEKALTYGLQIPLDSGYRLTVFSMVVDAYTQLNDIPKALEVICSMGSWGVPTVRFEENHFPLVAKCIKEFSFEHFWYILSALFCSDKKKWVPMLIDARFPDASQEIWRSFIKTFIDKSPLQALIAIFKNLPAGIDKEFAFIRVSKRLLSSSSPNYFGDKAKLEDFRQLIDKSDFVAAEKLI